MLTITAKYLEELGEKANQTVTQLIPRGVGILRRFKHFLPLSALKNIYYALIHSYIMFGCSIYACNFESNFKKVPVMQNKALRILGERLNCSGTVTCFKSLCILPVKNICEHQVGVFVYKSLNQICPSYSRNIYFDHAHYHEYETRNASLLVNDIWESSRGEFCVLGREGVGIVFRWESGSRRTGFF